MTSFNRQKTKNNDSIAKVKSISLGKRAIIFVCSMGAIGAIVGSIDSKVALDRCFNSEDCLTDNIVEHRVNRISIGAVAGMIAASMLSLPAIVNED